MAGGVDFGSTLEGNNSLVGAASSGVDTTTGPAQAPGFDPTAVPSKATNSSFLGGLAHDVASIPGVGWLGHETGQFAKDLGDAAINLPAGLWQLGKGTFTDPVHTWEQIPKGIYQDLQHPLRHPGYTALDALGLAGGLGAIAGRVGEAGAVLGRAGALPEDIARGAAGASAPEAGFVRLYRGEGGQVSNVPDWMKANQGRWFTSKRDTAERYASDRNGALSYVDVPESSLSNYAISGGSGSPEFLLPRSLADSRQLFKSDISPLEYAKTIGKQDTVSRALEPLSGLQKPVGRQVRDALRYGPPDQERLLPDSQGNLKSGWWYSKNPAVKSAQQLIDKMYDTFPDGKPPLWLRAIPGFQRSQAGRLASAAKATQTIERTASQADVNQFIKKWKDATSPEDLAVRMAGELTTPEALTHFHENMLESGLLKPFQEAETKARLALIPEAAKLLKTEEITLPSGKVLQISVPKDPNSRFAQMVEDSRHLTNMQQSAMHDINVLPTESMNNRLLAPYYQAHFESLPLNLKVMNRQLRNLKQLGHEDQATALEKQIADAKDILNPEKDVNVENGLNAKEQQDLINQARPFYVPYKMHEPEKVSFGRNAFNKATKLRNKPGPPSRLTHAFGAQGEKRTLLAMGGGRGDTHALIAENYTEAQRYTTLVRHYQSLLAGAKDTPEGIPPQYRELIKDVNINLPSEMSRAKAAEFGSQWRQTQEELSTGKLHSEDAPANGLLYEGVRQWLFKSYKQAKDIFSDSHDGEGNWRPIPGYKWVDSRNLGYLNKQSPLWGAFENPIARNALHTADIINDVQKDMVLYLKPAYAFPNAFGNLFLNAIQQGAFAPWNLMRGWRLFNNLKPETAEKIRQVMGGGFAQQVLKTRGVSGAVGKVGRVASNFYAKGVDDPFRFSSFLHEARRSGFTTDAEIEKLMTDPAHAAQVEGIANRASEEILNYERMSPGEQAILKRLVFFYPWLKASGRYASYFAKNHPVAAGATAPIGGHIGSKSIEDALGKIPTWAEGLIPFTGKNAQGHVLTGNPASFAILQQPADLAALVENLFSSHPNPNLTAVSNLAPFDAALLSALTGGKIASVPHPINQPPIQSALDEAFGGNPLFGNPSSFLESITGGPPRANSAYPDSSFWHALLRYAGTGGLTPRETNPQALNYSAFKAANQHGYTS